MSGGRLVATVGTERIQLLLNVRSLLFLVEGLPPRMPRKTKSIKLSIAMGESGGKAELAQYLFKRQQLLVPAPSFQTLLPTWETRVGLHKAPAQR